MIKLLPKNELAGLKAKQQERDIKEGEKVATRVDRLRGLWAKTEQEFEAYKTSTLAAIQSEINEWSKKKDDIQTQFRVLKESYDELLPEIPLKRAELAKYEKSLSSWERKLTKREEKAALLEIDVVEAKHKSENAKIRNEDNERISRNILIQAQKTREEAEDRLKTAKRVQDLAYKDKKEGEDALSLREIGIEAKETELSTREMEIMNDRKELNREKIKVEDMKQTLQRSLDRLKQGRMA